MGCDADFVDDVSFRHISIHASRMGCDLVIAFNHGAHQFQSTHPVWDATFSYMCPASRHEYFNPRIPYGMRPVAPCALSRCLSNFNPRIPYGMRHLWQYATGLSEDFNPRIPYGMRPNAFEQLWTLYPFQSTHPVWDATTRLKLPASDVHISIHASRMGCDE